jgi:hypothetical protein
MPDGTSRPWQMLGMDDLISLSIMVLFFLVVYLVLLALKLVLGMLLLRFARDRYQSMKLRTYPNLDTQGKRVGWWGGVEMDDEKKKHIYEGDPDGLQLLREREKKALDRERLAETRGLELDNVNRYEMAAKRIW